MFDLKQYPISMEIAGDTAMWTRPDTGDSPVSYPAPTYSAVQAIFRSILWGPAIDIIPTRVEICKPILYHSYSYNYGGPLRKSSLFKNFSNQQNRANVLIDVCYKLYGYVIPYRDPSGRYNLPIKAREWNNRTTSPGHAYQAIFERRLNRGQCYSVPFLGWKEFTPSYFGPLREDTSPLSTMADIEIPSMLREVFPFGNNSRVSFQYDYNLLIHKGVLNYPEKSEVHAYAE